jgi:hypothetical protein
MPHLPVMEMAGCDRQGHAGLQNRIVTFLEVGAFRDIEHDAPRCEIRKCYSALDLAADAGLLEAFAAG